MTARNSPLMLARRLAPLLLWPALAAANPVDVPLHLEPIRYQPFAGTRDDAAAVAIDGGWYLVYNGADYGCAPVGLPLLADGSPTAPVPLRLANFSWQCATSVTTGRMAGDALVAWSQDDHVYAVLQPHDTWTHITRPRIDLGVGKEPAVAGADDFGLVAFASSTGLVTVRVDAAAWPTQSAPIALAPGSLSSFTKTDAAFAAEAARAMVVWRFGSLIYWRIVDANGVPVVNASALGPGDSPSVSWNGSHFVVVWSVGPSGAIVLARIDANGVLLDNPAITVASSPGHAAASSSITGLTLVSWIADEFVPHYRVRAARVNGAGGVLDPGGFLVYDGARNPGTMASNQVLDVTASGIDYHVTWIENYPTCGGIIIDHQDVRSAVVGMAGPNAIGPSRIASASEQQYGLVAAAVGDRFWTAWLGRNRTHPELLAARRDATGALLDTEGLELGTEAPCWPIEHAYYAPATTGNSNAVLTAWRHLDYNDPWWLLCRVNYCVYNADGVRAGCNDFSYDDIGFLAQQPPVVATGGSNFLLAFTAPAPNDSIGMSWAGIADAGGQIGGGSVDLGFDEVLEDAASNGTSYLVSWSKASDGRDSFVGRFDAGYTFLDPAGILLAGGHGDQLPARLASDGKHYLAIWRDSGALRAARINAQGSILDPGGVVVAAPPSLASFDVDWDGNHYILAWSEVVAGQYVARLKRIAQDLSSPDPAPVELAQRPDALRDCRVASRDGSSLIAFTREQLPDGHSTGHGLLYINPVVAAVSPSPVPAPYDLGATPNPFWDRTEIMTGTAAGRSGIFRVHDTAGRLVHVMAAQGLNRTITWDGRDLNGRPLAAGTYFYEISSEGKTAAQGKVTKLR